MGFIDDELQEVSNLCRHDVEGSRIVSCVQTMVRVEITKTAFKKIVVCIQFPENYPKALLLLELKSKTLSAKLLDKLTEACEEECKNFLGKAQVLPLLKYIRNFIEENSLISCYDEITALKNILQPEDELKLKQKKSMINLKVYQGAYFFQVKIIVPDDYPSTAVNLGEVNTNFPPLFTRYLLGQGKELGRQCVQPPLRQKAQKAGFTPSPSLQTVVSFIIRTVKALPQEQCQLCKVTCLPKNPAEVVIDETASYHAERLYCGHLFHLKCLVTFMKTPPFHGGKKCPTCGQRVYHDKWGLSDKLAEDRWAHQQARARELAEVADFFE